MNKYTKNNHFGSGNDNPFYKGAVYQRGYGIGSQFKRFFNWIVPLFKKHAVPTLERGLKKLGEESINSVSNIAKDVISGKDLKSSAQENINRSISNLKQSVEDTLEGKGIKRKRSKILLLKKSKRLKDIFD